jgi:hypothetical protein
MAYDASVRIRSQRGFTERLPVRVLLRALLPGYDFRLGQGGPPQASLSHVEPGCYQSSGIKWTEDRMLVVLALVMELNPHKAAHGHKKKIWDIVALRMCTYPAFADDPRVSKVTGNSVRVSLCSMHFCRVHSGI